MQFLSTVLVALTAAAGVMGQGGDANAFATGLLDALRQNNLTQLASAVEANAAALLPALASAGNKTVLAPSNQAIQALGNVDQNTLVNTIAYHVLNGTYKVDQLMAGQHTIAATALNSSEFVNLPGDRPQVAVLSKAMGNNTAFVYQAGRNVSFAGAMDGPMYQNILVQPIEQVLMVPGNVSDVAGMIGVSQLVQLLQSANLVEALDSMPVTVFAPNNAAIQAAQSTIMAATPEQQVAVLSNHYIPGSVVYSTAIKDVPSATSGSGQELKFMANDTGAYVMSGNVTAKIVRTDYVAANGVVHVIDNVLLNTMNNPAAASSAAASAESAAATQTAQPGVGTGGNENAGSGMGGGMGGGSNENGAMSTAKIGGGAAALAMLASGMWLLA
ncbi:uncharacterized protein PFL1_04465 [Pseudozyma flocculosa PF-1]|uniref:FAS1 domain-containing protein n=2 Tax=Pseudozyma flocculosa TaxID=84751 RepID=A0A5C3FEM8_9BASI|nr:uncharacterized protein PFL1_04465 [Pseudozyma flocculosa PF-1]EPQ28138.1 hypothetical protein PFL1_04465 [Pseudozyma flocculosa PF-1]SPO41941.1 uncharacterized protein PSFLO_07424 [Pseudozyma flocculosa]